MKWWKCEWRGIQWIFTNELTRWKAYSTQASKGGTCHSEVEKVSWTLNKILNVSFRCCIFAFVTVNDTYEMIQIEKSFKCNKLFESRGFNGSVCIEWWLRNKSAYPIIAWIIIIQTETTTTIKICLPTQFAKNRKAIENIPNTKLIWNTTIAHPNNRCNSTDNKFFIAIFVLSNQNRYLVIAADFTCTLSYMKYTIRPL